MKNKIKFQPPTVKSLKEQGINASALLIGIAFSAGIREVLLKERKASDGTVKKPIIKDSVMVNVLTSLAGFGLAAGFSGNKFISTIFLGVGLFYAIRTAQIFMDENPATGTSGLSGKFTLRSFMDKYLPNLRGIEGSYDAADTNFSGGIAYVNEPMMLPMGYTEESPEHIGVISRFTHPSANPVVASPGVIHA